MCERSATQCEFSSAGRARPCQGRGHEFEPRNSLQISKKAAAKAVFCILGSIPTLHRSAPRLRYACVPETPPAIPKRTPKPNAKPAYVSGMLAVPETPPAISKCKAIATMPHFQISTKLHKLFKKTVAVSTL